MFVICLLSLDIGQQSDQEGTGNFYLLNIHQGMDNGYSLLIQQTRSQEHEFALAVDFDYQNGDVHFVHMLTFAAVASVETVAVD